jgi:hypothetical protein
MSASSSDRMTNADDYMLPVLAKVDYTIYETSTRPEDPGFWQRTFSKSTANDPSKETQSDQSCLKQRKLYSTAYINHYVSTDAV